MASNLIGEIRMVAFSKVPAGWNLCDGTVLQISANQSLFALLGTTYGGDGQTTFALPNLSGSIPVHYGGDGILPIPLGFAVGKPSYSLLGVEMPPHSHPANGLSIDGASSAPDGNWLAGFADGFAPRSAGTATTLRPASVQSAGTGTGHENRQPYLCVNYIIALVGGTPSDS